MLTIATYSQTGITYQAVILNPQGEELPGADNNRSPLASQTICLRFKIYNNANQLEYQETMVTTTDEFGMVNVVIGTGTYTGGTATTIGAVTWNGTPKNLVVEVDTTGMCTNFMQISNQPFTYVPYAFYAANSGSSSTPGPQGPIGLTGATGPQGIQGPIGLTGATGPAGPQGIAGTNGTGGTQGPVGANGLSAYQVAVANGYTGTETQWLASLVGAQGATGTFQNGNNIGDVLYWNGNSWTILPIGNEGQNLTVCGGIPHWGGCNSTTPIATISSITSCNTASTGSLYAGSTATGVTQTITLVVATIGTYNISASANGVTFSASGIFTNTGSQDVVLTANGVPSTSGTFFYTINTTPSCTFQVTVEFISNTSICGQVWMQRNLDVTHYRNGDEIPQVTDLTQWANLTTGAWCYYNNDPANGAVYGKLYNWYAVNDPRGIAPLGWHVPTNNEWTILSDCLGGDAVSGEKMKEIGNSHWANPNLATNSSGFTALPGGQITNSGGIIGFYSLGTNGKWWSSTQIPPITYEAWYCGLESSLINLFRVSSATSYDSYSIRCVKD